MTKKSFTGVSIVEYNRTRIFGAALLSTRAKALEEAGKAGVAESRRVVPVDTGKLRDSIRAEVTGDTLAVITDVEYGPYVEYGTSRMAARPYMRPGAEAAAKAFMARMNSIAIAGGKLGVLSSSFGSNIRAEVGGTE